LNVEVTVTDYQPYKNSKAPDGQGRLLTNYKPKL